MSTNVSKQKRDKIIEFIEYLKENAEENEDILQNLMIIKEEVIKRKYGLIWEEHEERVDIEMNTKIPVFIEDKDAEIYTDREDKINFLIEGDNLHSLHLLQKTHKGKVDCVYIDVPYNRGNNDFIYDDDEVGKDDGFKHSKWLSSIKRRLELIWKLLTPKGVIFISIDDNEQAPLKMLCDDLFGEDNFISCIPRRTKSSGKTTANISLNHDYILVYERNKNEGDIVSLDHIDDGFKYEDEFVNERGKYKLNQTLDYDSLSYSKSLDYELEINGEKFYPGTSYEAWLDRQNGNYKRADWAWRWSKNLFEFGYKNGFIVVNESKNGKRIYTKTYLNAKIVEDENGYRIETIRRKKPISTLDFTDAMYSNDNGKKDLKKFFGKESVFDYPKPVELIKSICKLIGNKDAVFLDCYAGSGTTAEAILEMNKIDGGKRKFILCTNNQNGICRDITYKRIEKVMKGYEFSGKKERVLYEKKISMNDLKRIDKILEEIKTLEENKKDEFDKISKSFKNGILQMIGVDMYTEKAIGLGGNLKYYKTEYIDKLSDDINITDELMRYIETLIQLDNGIRIDDDSMKIIYDDSAADEFIENENNLVKCKKIYISDNVLLTRHQEYILDKYNIEILDIPKYYFTDEIKEEQGLCMA